jgi:Recombination endonuclease VII
VPSIEKYRAMSPEKKKQYLAHQKEYRERPGVKPRIKKYDAIYKAQNREKLLAGKQQWYQNNREEILRKHREYKKKNHVKIMASRYAHQYGLTVDEWHTLDIRKRTELCMICGEKPYGRRARNKALGIDHCHKIRKFRGLLCSECNRGLGCFMDNPDLLIAAASYLKNYA